jgi:hypothetical protein
MYEDTTSLLHIHFVILFKTVYIKVVNFFCVC